MIDLTRLMFDDGATRPPIKHDASEGSYAFTWRGRKFIGKLWTQETFGNEHRRLLGWWFYTPDQGGSPREKVENFIKDPNWWASTFSPSAELPGWGREQNVYTDARSWQYSTHLMEIIEVF